MSSLLTNTAAMTALRSLQGTEKQLDAAEKQLSTGLRVSDPSDNPASWSIATLMRAQVAGYSASSDGLALTISGLNVAQAGLKSVLTNLNGIGNNIVAAAQPGVDRSAIQQDIAARQSGIQSAMESSSFNGVNQLNLNLGFTSNGVAYDARTFDLTTWPAADFKTLSTDFGQVIRNVTASGVDLGSRLNQATTAQNTYGTLIDATTAGIGALVDADMNLVSTRIQALDAQRQLGIIALSIANDNSKMILKLFGA